MVVGEKMKIVVLSRVVSQSSYLPGAPRRVKELIEGMHKKGWNVVIFNTYNVSVRTMCPRFLASFLEIILLFLKLMKVRATPHAVMFFSSLDGLIALFYRFFQDTKIIYCDRGDPVEGIGLSPIKNTVNRLLRPVELSLIIFLEKMICLKSDKIIFNSKSRLKKMEKRVGKKLAKAQVIPNNANPSWVQKWLSEKSKGSTIVNNMTTSWKNKKVIGFVGNLYEVGNGLDILLAAFKLVAERISESILVIVGDGPDKRVLEEKVTGMNLDDRAYFTGGVPNPLFYVTNFDVFVHPARHHSCPNAILEALMCGVPVIGSSVGGIPEILQNDDLLFTPGDSNELTNKIIRFFSNKSYKKKVKKLALRLRAGHSFDWQKVMCSTIEKSIKD